MVSDAIEFKMLDSGLSFELFLILILILRAHKTYLVRNLEDKDEDKTHRPYGARVGLPGFEPGTVCLRGNCSTN